MLPSLYHVLNYAPSCPPTTIKKLGKRYTLSELLALSFTELQEAGLSIPAIHYLQQPDWREINDDREWADLSNHHLITYDSPDYPPLLQEIDSAPILLYAIGQKELLFTPQIAMVGTRKPTAAGRETAKKMANLLVKVGMTITSGLALGIDGASHEGALQVQGKTIAVLGNGLSHYYPFTHRHLQAQIAENGLLLSEFPPNKGPRAEFFPQRNRIISGLSLATLVVEAATRSGSLITARLATAQGREVFAIPGSIYNPEAKGCHALIKQGVKLVETVDDILEELKPLLQGQYNLSQAVFNGGKDEKQNNKKKLSKNLAVILRQIDHSPTPLEVIMQRCPEQGDYLFVGLMELELAGYIVLSAGGYSQCA